MGYLVAPNGDRVTATVETVIITYDILSAERDESGSIILEYGESEEHWDSAEQINRPDDSGKPQPVYQTADGSEYLESELTLVEEEAE